MNSFGESFRVEIFGESHGHCVGALLDGVPPGLPLAEADFEADLGRRRGGGAKGATPRKEADVPQFVTGVFEGHTTGAPLMIQFPNANTDSSAYAQLRDTPRPGHADWVAHQRFGGFQDYRGGGHFSGRLTTAIVAAGVVAKKLLPCTITARLVEAGGSTDVEGAIEAAMADLDSIGGIVECQVDGVPVGWGEPFFDSVESRLAHAMFAIPAIKGVEFGAGFEAARMRGSDHNDELVDASGRTGSNNAGGINGGLTNGNPLVFRIAVKPTSSIRKEQHTVSLSSQERTKISVRGRHDACIALRVPVVCEAMTAIVLADLGRRPVSVWKPFSG